MGAAEWGQIRAAFPGNSTQLLNDVLAGAGINVEQPFRGVDTGSLEGLELTLRELSEYYAAASPEARRGCREMVIAAKERARFASRGASVEPARREFKARMVQWMLVWLEDPAVFPIWATLRQAAENR